MIRAPDIEGAIKFLKGVHLDERIKLAKLRGFVERLEFGLLKGRDNQEDGVGAGARCLKDLHLIDDEIFAQTRQRDRAPHLGQIAETSVKDLLVREHRHGVCASRFVSSRNRHGLECFDDRSGRRRCFFHLGDQSERFRTPI